MIFLNKPFLRQYSATYTQFILNIYITIKKLSSLDYFSPLFHTRYSISLYYRFFKLRIKSGFRNHNFLDGCRFQFSKVPVHFLSYHDNYTSHNLRYVLIYNTTTSLTQGGAMYVNLGYLSEILSDLSQIILLYQHKIGFQSFPFQLFISILIIRSSIYNF